MIDSSKFKSTQVLVVDDTKSVRQVLSTMVRAHGVASVLEAGDGAEAFRIVERSSRPFDLIFCDLQMPGIDGVDTLRGISARLKDCKVVLISALDPKLLRAVGYMAAKMGLQVVGTLAKPFTEEQVGKILERYHAMRTRRDFFSNAPVSPEELREALVHGAIEVYYQPKIQMSDRRLLGVEALARMRHPLYGLVGPDSFIHVAEASGDIIPLTQTVLEQALAQAGRWVAAM
jgi:CheY-like chemotaxis protein